MKNELNNQSIFGINCTLKRARAVIFGVPYDGTTSYRPGTRFGPRAFRAESYGFESYSPYLEKDILELPIHDSGDLDLPFGDKQKTLSMIKERTAKIFNAGKIPIMLGGEHLVTLGAVSAAAERFPDLCILHLDAHADLRDDYIGEKFSHATVMRRCHDLIGDGSIFQFGIRSGTVDEFRFAANHTHCKRFDLQGFEQVVATLSNRPIYLSIDLDVLDPSVFPGTGTPEAGGISFQELLAAIHALFGSNVVGADLCELSPTYDPSGISVAAGIKALRELCLSIVKSDEI